MFNKSVFASVAGNNAVEMETTAHYDKEKQEFVINTPSTKAQKYWITNGLVAPRSFTNSMDKKKIVFVLKAPYMPIMLLFLLA
jgi:hypothetical protein